MNGGFLKMKSGIYLKMCLSVKNVQRTRLIGQTHSLDFTLNICSKNHARNVSKKSSVCGRNRTEINPHVPETGITKRFEVSGHERTAAQNHGQAVSDSRTLVVEF